MARTEHNEEGGDVQAFAESRTVRPGVPTTCAICGRSNVRARTRRFYDVPINWARFVIEYLLQMFSSGRRGAYYGVPGGPQAREYEQHRMANDERVSTMTPRAFWRCNDCGHKGEVFDDFAVNGRLYELEEEIEAQGGVVGDAQRPRHD